MEERFFELMMSDCDDEARLVFADWLEEQGDPRGPVLSGMVPQNCTNVPLLNYFDTKQKILYVTYEGIMYHYVIFERSIPRQVRINWVEVLAYPSKPYLMSHPAKYDWTSQSSTIASLFPKSEDQLPQFLRIAMKYWRNGKWWPRIDGYHEGDPHKRRKKK